MRYASHGEPTLRDISLEVMPGECVVITGPSGCGKTTLTRLVNGLIPHAYSGDVTGQVKLRDCDVSTWTTDELGVEVGSVFQNPRSQFVNIDVTSEVAFGCESLGLPQCEIIKRVEESSCVLGIQSLLGRSVDALSGGQKQSVILASAYAMRPEVFVLDEPTASLDIESMRRLASVLSRLKGAGKAILVSEHRLWWLSGIADRIIAMEDGRITAEWSADEFSLLSIEERRARGLRSWKEFELVPCDFMGESGSDAPRAHKAAPAEDALEARRITFGYSRHTPILHGLNLSLRPGSILGVIGENGAGKTTLLRCLCGLEKEGSGAVFIAGEAMRPKRRSNCVHLVMQEPGYQLFADSVLAEAVGACDDESKARDILGRFGLLSLAERHPLSLSGGERQRLSIAVGMLRGSRVILLDEPTSGLDYKNMRRVADSLREAAAAGCALCIVTHDFEFLCETCDEVVEMAEGVMRARYPLDRNGAMTVAESFGHKPVNTCG